MMLQYKINTMYNYPPPYLGVAYYPECWTETELKPDVLRMKKLGINLVRLGEFAWSKIEPEQGKYKFGWLHRVFRTLNQHHIGVVLCTPTAAPPVWLTSKYPEMLRVNENLVRSTHGGRRHYCPNSVRYRTLSRQITERITREFYRYDNLVAWQLDNEFNDDCYCPVCETAFHRWLARKYKSIKNLNRLWNTNLWSNTYTDFKQIPLPNALRAQHHPSLVYQYRHFISDSYTSFAEEQAGIIKKYSPKPVTTNGMPIPYHRIDYEKMYQNLDFVANDVYDKPEFIWRLAFEFDWMRPLKPHRPYWIMETSVTGCGALSIQNMYIHHPGALRAKLWLAYALGGEAVLFWLWRAHSAGQEMEHGSVLYSWGDTTLNVNEIIQTHKELCLYTNFLRDTQPLSPSVAIHISTQSRWIFEYGSIAPGFQYYPAITEFYQLFFDLNIPRDLVYPHGEIDKYKVIFSPYLPVLPDKLVDKIVTHVARTGSTWVLGPLSACRTEENTTPTKKGYGKLEKIIGIHLRHRFPVVDKNIFINFKHHRTRVKCRTWCDAFVVDKKSKVLATYTNGPAAGYAAIVEVPVGKGKVIVFGTLPEKKFMHTWIKQTCFPYNNTNLYTSSKGIVTIPRVDNNNKIRGMIAVNVLGTGGYFYWEKKKKFVSAYGVEILIR